MMTSSVRGASLALLLSLCAAACAAPEAETATTDSNLDTSGCSGLDLTVTRGPVNVSSARPPRSRCWNAASSGLTVTYSWTQKGDSNPQKTNVGFWTSLNGGGLYGKASSYECREANDMNLGHETNRERSFQCTAKRTFTFESSPELLRNAYGADGSRGAWQVEVAVSLDDAGSWDSLGGANYRFTL